MSGSLPPRPAPAPRGHLPFALLLAAVVPAIIGFVWQQGVASIGDDSVSYLVLARYLSPFGGDGHVAPWAPYHSHFPPLLPLALALTGGDRSLLAAHLLVGACAGIRRQSHRLDLDQGHPQRAALSRALPRGAYLPRCAHVQGRPLAS